LPFLLPVLLADPSDYLLNWSSFCHMDHRHVAAKCPSTTADGDHPEIQSPAAHFLSAVVLLLCYLTIGVLVLN
jgi:hypothetical protein